MTVAEYLADKLHELGVRYVFGIPGGASIPYIESLRSAGIDFILTSHEASAGVMADVTARLTGIPGVCHATFGPGATNISTGAGCAFLDRSPVIVLTSELEEKFRSRTSQMNIDHQKLFRPLTKATFRLNPENAAEIISKSFSLCREEYPGPVHIGLPAGIADAAVIEWPGPEPVSERIYFSNDTGKIISLLRSSSKPLIAVGRTSARLLPPIDLIRFLDKFRVPVVLTPMAKGMIPEDHPSYGGILFHALSDCLGTLIERADLIIGLGYDPVEYNYESWLPQVPLISFNTKETDLPPSVKSVQYVGNPGEWLKILDNINAPYTSSDGKVINEIRDEMASVFNGFTAHFGPVSVVKILQEELPADAIITSDVGSHLHLLGQYWKTGGRQNLIMTNGWSGMGFGIPAGLAAQLAFPSSTVVTVTGDGGFLMAAGEIMTARRYNLPLITVVMSDEELNLIRLKKFWHDLSPYGTELYSGELFGADIFLGIPVLNADTEFAMRKAVNRALSFDSPVIINARIDPEDYKWLIVRQD
jgi:acetolactate synthase I/II/III large subunit